MSMSVRGSGACCERRYCAGISSGTAPVTATKLLSGAVRAYAPHAGLGLPISGNRGYLAESSAEGSIPSPQRRHHVDLHWTTGAADRPLSAAVEETSGVFGAASAARRDDRRLCERFPT